MEIVGEKINGTRKRVAEAVTGRDTSYVQDLAKRQTEAGAAWLDVNAGTAPAREAEDLVWLITTIQAVVETPLCLDSANPAALAVALQAVARTPMINSISGEPARLQGILPLAVKSQSPLIALAMDEKGIPKTVSERLDVIRRIVSETRRQGLPDQKLYIDPLAMAISTNTESGMIALTTMRMVRAEFPDVHLTCGLSNISFGLPVRSKINRVFVTLAMEAGLDSAILDPLDREMRAVLIAADLVLGRDRHCLRYTRAYRAGLLEDTG
ncbi:MAG TPA: dihydropteroate synthase [Spirochaetia bacterium]|nr:dihydropteroate synthase [Spirochaetia bacterium]